MTRKEQHQSVPPRPAGAAPVESGPAALVQIEKPVYGGAFLARIEGKAVFVPLALPGEQARVRIADNKHGYAKAEIDEVITAAAERIAPACRHFGICGGCDYQHAGYAAQLGFKQQILRETLERGGVRAPEQIHLLAGTEAQAWGYRNRIRLAFDPQGNPGYRSRRSNSIVPIAECPIAAPLLVAAAQSFAEVARQFSSLLQVTEVSLFCDATETTLLASVFTGSESKKHFDELARTAHERIPAMKGMELVRVHGSGVRDPSRLPRTIAQWGNSSLTYGAAGINYRVDHGAFFQVNRWLGDALVTRVTEGKRGKLAWDLFAGVGLFACKLASSYDAVVAVESAPPAIPGLKENLREANGGAARTEAVRASTLEFLRLSNKTDRPELIVVDPPRSGLGAEITTLLAGIGAPALTYVSCDPATLTRDLRALLASGYAIEKLTLADLFPQTFHLESVVELRRA